nr:MAG TPA: early protein [Bacteriophage sp.]
MLHTYYTLLLLKYIEIHRNMWKLIINLMPLKIP